MSKVSKKSSNSRSIKTENIKNFNAITKIKNNKEKGK